MQIVADENIPLLDQFFSEFGDIVRVPGRTMTAADVADADILIVRSVTEVNEQLLAGSKVKFVGTATIGTDHIDLDYLEKAGIGFRSAPGCNAQAVVDYVLSQKGRCTASPKWMRNALIFVMTSAWYWIYLNSRKS